MILYEGAYKYLLDRAFALPEGGSFILKAGERGTFGLYIHRTKPEQAVNRIRVKMHQFGQAKRLKIRVRLTPDHKDIQIFRGFSDESD